MPDEDQMTLAARYRYLRRLRQTAKHYTQTPEGAPWVRRRHDVAMSPYARLLQSGVLSTQAAEELAVISARTNPRELRREIQSQLARLHAMTTTPLERRRA
ncbi:MAG: hypothetical protein ACYC5M_15785 [Anaerolineae bacterium]